MCDVGDSARATAGLQRVLLGVITFEPCAYPLLRNVLYTHTSFRGYPSVPVDRVIEVTGDTSEVKR